MSLTSTFIPPSRSLRPLMATCSESRPQNRKRQHAEADLSQDDLPSRIRKRRTQQRFDSQQFLSVPLRRSARLRSKQCSTSIPHDPSLPKQRPTGPRISNTCLPTPDPVEPVPSRAQLQEYLPHNQIRQVQKREFDRSIEISTDRPSKRARLTEKNLKLWEMGGAKKSSRKRSTGQSSSTATTNDKESKSKASDTEIKSTRSRQTVSTTDSGFQDIAFNNGVLNPVNSRPPTNLDLREDRLNRTRDTVSPSESEYRYFASAIQTAPNESSVLYETSQLLKRYDEPGYYKRYNQSFSNFPKNVGFNNGLSAAQPGMVEGLNMLEFQPFLVREQLGGAATVYPGPAATTLPHLAGEWKGPGKDMIKAQTQAAYDGACMVYGRNQARTFLESPDPDGHAYVSTFTTDGTTLNTFAHYSSESQGQVKYHQYPTSSSLLISTFRDFKKSRERLRNVQDDAKEISEKLRDELNEKWSANQQHIYKEDDEDEDSNNDSYVSPPMSHGIKTKTTDPKYCDGYNYDGQEDQEDQEDGPSSQLLTEYYSSFTKDKDGNEDNESLCKFPPPMLHHRHRNLEASLRRKSARDFGRESI